MFLFPPSHPYFQSPASLNKRQMALSLFSCGGLNQGNLCYFKAWSQGSPTLLLGPQGSWDPRGLGKRPRASDRRIRSQVGSVGLRPGWRRYSCRSRLPRPDPARYTVICLGKELSPPGIREGTLAGVPLSTPSPGVPAPQGGSRPFVLARLQACTGDTCVRRNGRNACIRTPPSPFP